jgi:hypothetical protein
VHDSAGIEYRELDVADPAQFDSLPESGFDAVVCNMALMGYGRHRPARGGVAQGRADPRAT